MLAHSQRGRDQRSPALLFAHRRVSEATHEVPMSHPPPAAPVLWRPHNPALPKAPGRPWSANPGPSRAGSRHGILHVSTGFPGCRKTRLDHFPFALDGDGAGAELGPGPGAGPGRGEGGVARCGRGPRSGAIKARQPAPPQLSCAPPCVCVCVLGSRPQFLLRHSHGGADGESLPAGQGGDGPRDPPLLPAAARPLPGYL